MILIYIYIYISFICVVIVHILVHINIRVRGHIDWAGKLGKIMYAEYIVHGLCDTLLTVHILEDELWTLGMDPWEL